MEEHSTQKLQFSLSLEPDVVRLLPEELALSLDVLPLCQRGTTVVIVAGRALKREQVSSLETVFEGGVYPIPSQLIDLGSLFNDAQQHSDELLQYFRKLAEQGHFLRRFVGTQSSLVGAKETESLIQALCELGLLSVEELASARSSGETVSPALFIDPKVLQAIPDRVARNHQVLPLKLTEDRLIVAAGKQPSRAALSELKLATGRQPETVLVKASEVTTAIDKCYRRVSELGLQQMRLGEILLRRGVISQSQLDRALKLQGDSGKRLGEILVIENFTTEEMIYRALSEKLSLEFFTFSYTEVNTQLRGIISQRFAENHQVLPIRLEGVESEELVVATANPQDLAVMDLLKKIADQKGYKLRLAISPPTSIQQGIAYTYHSDDLQSRDIEMETVTFDESVRSDLVLSSEMPQIKKVLNSLLYQAVVDGASDIHIENLESRVRIRFRIDGLLQMRETPVTKENIGQIISVLKIDSGLDITERRRPQDGGFKKRIGKDWMIDFRLNVHNTQFGPDAVIRILDNSKRLPKLDQLGMPPEMLSSFLRLVQNPQGLILITGPTGSGKSTTLCSTLNFLNLAEKKIVTAEDPVEYHLEGVCQYQVSERLGNTFGEYGRRFLRKDPDIILIGETRDEETTESCLRAAMTGHLVFTTLHTNNTIAAVARLLDLGGDRSSICDAVLAVLAQRLVRKNCQACLQEYSPSSDLLQDFFGTAASGVRLLHGVGCIACNHTGYVGRTGVYEMWELTRLAREAILNGEGEAQLSKLAKQAGFQPLVADALAKVMDGFTTLEELRRVTPLDQLRNYAPTARRLYLNSDDGRLKVLPSA